MYGLQNEEEIVNRSSEGASRTQSLCTRSLCPSPPAFERFRINFIAPNF